MQRDGHYPYQTIIDAYGNGGFRFADMSHNGSILCLPSGMHAWPVKHSDEITIQSLAPVFAQSDKIDVLFIGLGAEISFLASELRQTFADHKIIVEAIGTGGAVRTYNIMLGESRAVAAALIGVERPAPPAPARVRAGQAGPEPERSK